MTRACLFVFVVLTSVTMAAQSSAPPPTADSRDQTRSRDDEKRPRTLTLTGCVEKGAMPTQYTLLDMDNGRYEVSGSQISKYLGRRVQVAGTPGSTRFRVKGGLWPTPNVAAQAGAMNPAKAAVAALPGGGAAGTGEIALPSFKVKAIRQLDGSCE